MPVLLYVRDLLLLEIRMGSGGFASGLTLACLSLADYKFWHHGGSWSPAALSAELPVVLSDKISGKQQYRHPCIIDEDQQELSLSR